MVISWHVLVFSFTKTDLTPSVYLKWRWYPSHDCPINTSSLPALAFFKYIMYYIYYKDIQPELRVQHTTTATHHYHHHHHYHQPSSPSSPSYTIIYHHIPSYTIILSFTMTTMFIISWTLPPHYPPREATTWLNKRRVCSTLGHGWFIITRCTWRIVHVIKSYRNSLKLMNMANHT